MLSASKPNEVCKREQLETPAFAQIWRRLVVRGLLSGAVRSPNFHVDQYICA